MKTIRKKNILFRAFVLFLPLLLQTADATAKSQNLTISGDHGKLSVILQTPDGAAKSPLVMILPGFGARKEMPLLAKIADNLEQAGISSVRFDFNGHGDSDGDFRDMTVENEIADAEKVFAYVSALPETAASFRGPALIVHGTGDRIVPYACGERYHAVLKKQRTGDIGRRRPPLFRTHG